MLGFFDFFVCVLPTFQTFWVTNVACSLLWNFVTKQKSIVQAVIQWVYGAKKKSASRPKKSFSVKWSSNYHEHIFVVATSMKAKGSFLPWLVALHSIPSHSRVINGRVKRKSPQMRLNTVWKMIRNPSAHVLIPFVLFPVTSPRTRKGLLLFLKGMIESLGIVMIRYYSRIKGRESTNTRA